MSTGHKVFVYGSLRRGSYNAHYLEGAKFLGEAFTVEAMLLFNGPFPCMAASSA